MVDRYFDEKQNASIKKYKSVVSEYYKKYTNEISSEKSVSAYPLKEELKHFLNKRSGMFNNEEELLIGYWSIELIGVNR